MSNETILIGNILASIFQPIYYCLFMTFTKNIKENRIKFILLTILDYIFIQNIVHFKLGVNADLLYAITFNTYERLYGLRGTVGYISGLFPNHTILITMNGHITCSKNGIIYDTFDCRDRQTEFVWLVN